MNANRRIACRYPKNRTEKEQTGNGMRHAYVCVCCVCSRKRRS